MTINGPAPMLLGYFMNTAIDQNCEKYIKENGLEFEVNQKLIKFIPEKKDQPYQGDLPEGNDGLGLIFLRCYGRSSSTIFSV